MTGVINTFPANNPTELFNITKGSSTTVRFADFGADVSPTSLTVRVSSIDDVVIKVQQKKKRGGDFVDVASCAIDSTGGFDTWKEVSERSDNEERSDERHIFYCCTSP